MPSKEEFLKSEFWMLSFLAAFQRNSIYKENVIDKDKKAFKVELKAYIKSNIIPLYKKKISDEQHTAFLISMIDISKYHKSILVNGQISVGTAQKLLNLVLKYFWCLGLIHEPPHFPVDSRIQEKLPAKDRKAWTKINSIRDYMSVINTARNQLKKGETLAEWELINFNRN